MKKDKTATEVASAYFSETQKKERLRKLREEASRADQAVKLSLERGWMPMLGAPADGRDILLYSGPDFDPIIGIGHWENPPDEFDLFINQKINRDMSVEDYREYLKAGWGDYQKQEWPEMWRAIEWPRTG